MTDDRWVGRSTPGDPGLPHERLGSSVAPTADGSIEKGNDRDFVTFYRTFTPQLVRFLIWHGAGLELAADIAQDSMRIAYRNWINIDHPRMWARRVASRELARRVAEIDFEVLTDQVPESTVLVPDNISLSEGSNRVIALLRRLPPRQRQVMAWTYDGYSPQEIALELRISPEAVRSNLRKARHSLIEHMGRRGTER